MGHSKVIESIKGVKETIEDNHSTEQLFDVLDRLLYSSVYYAMLCSTYFEHNLIAVNAWYSTSQRRKITRLSKEQFAGAVMMLNMLPETDFERRFVTVKSLGLERNIIIFMLDKWLELATQLTEVQIASQFEDSSKQNHLASEMRVHDLDVFFHSAKSVKYFLDRALEFRSGIGEKYMRLVVNEVAAYNKAVTRSSGARQSVDDISQNFLMAVYKAIDKCDPHKGTLTSYIQWWINSAKTSSNFRHEVGTAFILPSGQRNSDQKNFTLDVTDEELAAVVDDTGDPLDVLTKKTEIDRIRRIAKAADPKGYGRLALGITEVLSKKELRLLNKQLAHR